LSAAQFGLAQAHGMVDQGNVLRHFLNRATLRAGHARSVRFDHRSAAGVERVIGIATGFQPKQALSVFS
jgi:hypothetical protein